MIKDFLDACSSGDVETATMLLPSVDPSYDCNYAICVASENGHVDIVKMLLADPRVDPSDKVRYALLWSSRRGYIEIVRLLLENPSVSTGDKINVAIRWAKYGNNNTEITNKIIDLLTEHQFRLDGPEYNKNIIT